MFNYYHICDYDPQSLTVEELQRNNEFLEILLPQTGVNVPNSERAIATYAQDPYSQEKLVNSLPHASASQVHLQDSAKTKNPDTVQEATLGIPLFSVECFSPFRPVSQNSKGSADSYKVSRINSVSKGSVKTVGFLSSTQKACALPKLDDNTPVSIPKSSAKTFSILSGFDNNMDIHTLKEQFWQIKRQILDFYDEYVVTSTRNLAHGLFSSMHIPLLPEPDILFICKQTVEISDKDESQQSETKQPVIRNESLLQELDTVAASIPDPDLLFLATVYPVSSSTVTEEQIFDLPLSDLDVKPATPVSPVVSLKLTTPENQQSETEAQVLKDVIFPTKTKDLNLNLVFEDLMISTVLNVLLQETIINSKARAENVGNSVKVISEETPVLFSKERPFNVNRGEDQLPVVETPCKETISDTTNTPQSTCNEEIPVLSEDHPKELVCGTSTFSDANPVSKDMKTLVAPEFDTRKSSKMKENSDFFMVTLRTPVTHVSQVSMLCKPQTTTIANTAAETDISYLSEGVTDLTVTNTPIISCKEESIKQETNVIKKTAHNAIPDLLAPESTSPETNSMHSSHIT
ncbi:hypothetical protein NDU88_003207 [Pleurodeles waltl]|uniref:Uncharacterized protein n=1 Tax=Pleurodeles waltl TaxID=8319 RepID=A0AAV7NKT2_PLEWA|nr:hypothetical protein NDU88_003207 [Pleurodeles waltl]